MGNLLSPPKWPEGRAFVRKHEENRWTSAKDEAVQSALIQCDRGAFVSAVNDILPGAGHLQLMHDIYNGTCTRRMDLERKRRPQFIPPPPT